MQKGKKTMTPKKKKYQLMTEVIQLAGKDVKIAILIYSIYQKM